MAATKTKTVKEIRVDVDKCTGCKTCELACSAVHSTPKYSAMNPARSRIKVIMDEARDLFVPIRAGEYTQAECNGRNLYVIEGKEYSECTFCPASCPSRDSFKEPDSGLPLKCDMCESEDPPEPMCVKVCQQGALTYEAREEVVPDADDTGKHGEMELGLEHLVQRYGMKTVIEQIARMAKGKH
ncbi:MAG: (4Fe-4S)-binding protein [Deltaproteobacteria bacterium]|nr:(4Fe-4S)-binding protein [Deltaproteobacteria bacterium]